MISAHVHLELIYWVVLRWWNVRKIAKSDDSSLIPKWVHGKGLPFLQPLHFFFEIQCLQFVSCNFKWYQVKHPRCAAACPGLATMWAWIMFGPLGFDKWPCLMGWLWVGGDRRDASNWDGGAQTGQEMIEVTDPVAIIGRNALQHFLSDDLPARF